MKRTILNIGMVLAVLAMGCESPGCEQAFEIAQKGDKQLRLLGADESTLENHRIKQNANLASSGCSGRI